MTRKQVHLTTSGLGIVGTLGFVYAAYDLYRFSLDSPNVGLTELAWGAKAGTFAGMGVSFGLIILAIVGSVRWMPRPDGSGDESGKAEGDQKG